MMLGTTLLSLQLAPFRRSFVRVLCQTGGLDQVLCPDFARSLPARAIPLPVYPHTGLYPGVPV